MFSSSSPNGFGFDTTEGRRYPEDEALSHVGSAMMQELLDVMLDTPLEDHLLIAEGILGGLHTAAQRIERDADRARDEMNRGVRDFDGSEVADTELQQATARARACDAALAAVEKIRDAAAASYTVATVNDAAAASRIFSTAARAASQARALAVACCSSVSATSDPSKSRTPRLISSLALSASRSIRWAAVWRPLRMPSAISR